MTPPPAASFAGWDDETFERELERVTTGPSADVPIDDLELAAAAVHLAALDRLEAPPAALMERLRAQARALQHEADGDETARGLRALPPSLPPTLGRGHDAPGSAPAPGFLAWAGWLVAAGILTVFLVPGGGALDPRRERENLLAAADAIVLDWSATDDAYAGSVSGDVVWSTAEQRGFMRFRDLAPNDPAEIQYQLWIFDGSRPDSPPVDGGVFDVGPEGEILVPIDAKLGVGEPTLFAVTVERPGGVVVSAKEHIIVIADATKG